ncbi:nucleolar protein 8 isoform X2 [Macrotis lagotis]|uniref:nucleolar protein 8 isoform X2 n=1 Tax=Macrotis lagotis TaxID=92651 RepID=UPI003D6855B9
MAASAGERRLFVGGLGPSVTRDDVRAQLARFGNVSSVELVSRVNELGSPGKTFAYVNIRLSEGDLKRCLSALNRTTWKGGTLQVQLAKESFLHRLAKERLQAQAKQDQQHPDGTTANSRTALGKNQGLEFHMKAVPGTEVPGHKDWVVSKFGRVLPILHLRSQNRRKILKYDPSKYCHNLKKFEQGFTNPVSVSDLTWKLEGGDDVMSKKRQGQFPTFRSCPPKRAKVGGDHCSSSKAVECPELALSARPNLAQWLDGQKAKSRPAELPATVFPKHKEDQKTEAGLLHPSKSPIVRSKNSMSDDDIDSEEELKAMIAEETKSQMTIFQETNSTARASFEVVSSDFKPNSGVKHKSMQPSYSNGTAHLAEDDQEYDSGDTDEIIAGGKIGDKSKDKQKSSPENKSKQTEKAFLKNSTNCTFHHVTETDKRKNSSSKERKSINCTKHIAKKLSSVSPESENKSEEELDYKSMMTNCYRLDLTLAELEKLANEDSESLGGNAKCAKQTLPSSQNISSGQRAKKAPNKGARCIDPEDILASLLEGEEKISNQNPPKENRLKSKFQAFRGMGALFGGEMPKKPFRNSGITTQIKGQNSLQQEESPGSSMENQAFDSNACLSDEISAHQDGRRTHGADSLPGCPGTRQPASGDQHCNGLSPFSSECENALLGTKKPLRLNANPCKTGLGSNGCRAAEMGDAKQERRTSVTLGPPPGPEPEHKPANLKTHYEKCPSLSVGRDSASSQGRKRGKDSEGSWERETEYRPPFTLTDAFSPQKKSQDNQKRLAALEERRREVQLQKQLVHSALASLDGRGQQASKPTHIVFGSDSEDEAEEEDGNQKPLVGNGVKRDLTSKSSGKLFESSEDEEQETDDETRFQIKPQFEGKAGKKLMSLQAHFGADERFRMDARFLESESEEEEEEMKTAETAEEEELIAEKKKNLEVIQNVLHISHQAPKPSKEETAAKQFRNIVRYDPTRQDHSTFERKVPPEQKESKAKRRKKREEAEKLPQVSKDLYYTIAADLKERFRATAPEPATGAGAAAPWNEMPEEEEAEMASAVVPGAPDPPPGCGDFTFSFFGPDVREVKEEPYKSEPWPPGRVAWQQDPRFQDSSSEEEDEREPAEGSKDVAKPEEGLASGKPVRRFFFFCENDERLSAGPGAFWRGPGARAGGEDWEARTLALLQDCRKKHKAARRRARS